MRRLAIVLSGAAVGFLETSGIWFDPGEPYPTFIVAAGTIKGALVALLIASFVRRGSSLRTALLVGGTVGLAFSAVVFFSKGGWKSWGAPLVVPFGVASGVLLGAVVRWLNGKADTSS